MEYTKPTCKLESCTDFAHPKSVNKVKGFHEYCRIHQVGFDRTGDPLGVEPLEFCTLDDCHRRHYKRGLCAGHSAKLKKYGRTHNYIPARDKECTVDGCSRNQDTKGLCSTHYQRYLTNGSAGSAEISPRAIKPCAINLCSKNGGLKDSLLCSQHRQLARNYGIDEDRYTVLANSPCQICRATSSVMSIDHDHSCCSGRESCGACVRGALCSRCNRVLGSVGDDVALLKAMVLYLA